MTAQDYFVGFIYLCRFVTVGLGSVFGAMLVLAAKDHWRYCTRGEKYGVAAMLTYTANVTGFTALSLASTPPTFPNSLIYVGWIASFVLGYQMLFHARKVS